MAIQDGMRTHDEGLQPRYRMPDLLTKEEMVLYFAGTYGVGIEFTELSDTMREKTQGVGVLPVATVVSDRDREMVLLRRQLGLEDLEKKLDVLMDGRVKELDSRTMTREQFADKYGEQPPVETPEEKEARLNPTEDQTDVPEGEPVGEGNTDQVEGPVPTVETEEERQARKGVVLPEKSNPSDELNRLLENKKQTE